MAIIAKFEGGIVTFKANQIKAAGRDAGDVDVGLKRITPANEYWFNYWFKAWDPWILGLGGKMPGLAGGRATAGGADIHPGGWSSRVMWGTSRGGLREYRYDQDRTWKYGTSYPWSDDARNFEPERWYRVNQWVKINIPNEPNGAVKFWLNGKLVWQDNAVRWRGHVETHTARVDKVRMSIFRGGGDDSWAVGRDTRMEFSDFFVLNCEPNMTVGSPGTVPVCGQETVPELIGTLRLQPGNFATVDGREVKIYGRP